MKIEIGKWVTFFNEKKGIVAPRRGVVINRLIRRAPSGKIEDVVTVEYSEDGVRCNKIVDVSAIYPTKWDAALALYNQVAPIVEPFSRDKKKMTNH